MILWVFGFPDAEARKSSIISPNSGDLFRYFNFHFTQSVPAGALLASSTNSMSLISKSVLLARSCKTESVRCEEEHEAETSHSNEGRSKK